MTYRSDTIAEKLERQRELEENCLALGSQRFRSRIEQAQSRGVVSSVGAAHRLLVEAIQPMEQALAAFLQHAKTKRGPKHVAVPWLERIGSDVAAYMTAKVVLDGMLSRVGLRKAAFEITELMRDELRYRRFKQQAPALFQYRMDRLATSNYAYLARSLRATMSYIQIDVSDLEMTQNVRWHVGAKCIDLFIQATGLCALESVRVRQGRRMKQDMQLVATQDTRMWLDTKNAALEFLWPVNLPMVVPPLPWGQQQRGGYRFALRGKHRLVRGASIEHQRTLDTATMPLVYEAVNRIQETAWAINPHVLALVQEIVQRGGGMVEIPATEDAALPDRPFDIDTNKPARDAWRKRAAEINVANHWRQVAAKTFNNTLATALSVAQEEAIWFPSNLDFRGRVYPIVNYLSPQGDDLSKALLRFADGKPLGADGATWLATHGANCLGETPDGVKLSKATLQERVDWIVAHSREIVSAVRDPFTHRWWMDAEDPLQFYAFCVEWAGYAALARAGRGEEYVCALPCAMDGTCNGLQHFAALLRDETGAKAVNVTPSARPQDIYQNVTDDVLERLSVLATGADEAADFARRWIRTGVLARKLFKRPTMTFGYGSKTFGFRAQIIEFVKLHERAKELLACFVQQNAEGKDEHLITRAAALLADCIWEALEGRVAGAFVGMDWLQQVARLVAADGGCVSWTVPGTGFPVRQEYMMQHKRQIETVIAGRVIQPAVYDTLKKPNRVKQANAVAPNFVHSLDAAALMMTVEMAAQDGVEFFGMVHDSYATLPADCAVLASCTRAAFHSLYQSRDVLAVFREEVSQQIPEQKRGKVPALPMRGTLDLAQVFASEYFFS